MGMAGDLAINLRSLFHSTSDNESFQPIAAYNDAIISQQTTNRNELVAEASEDRRTVIIGGRAVEWEAIVQFLEDMKLKLVPSNDTTTETKGKRSVRRKKGERELHNLQFGVNCNKHPEKGEYSLSK
ncbi:hypothetical protein PanWU01x14_345280 [Parasponia andersonii]|uniref:Uncharacterized protein n=1 Tax=Parasponia andersonii TaxID=3476 RepID=A0A2P5ACS2_PARAD|nr:hypothetical protein PanWU01x14_345280 [Parasponia andersonii]